MNAIGKEVTSRAHLVLELARADEAADATEYALMMSLAALAIIGGVLLLGTSLSSTFVSIRSSIPNFVANLTN